MPRSSTSRRAVRWEPGGATGGRGSRVRAGRLRYRGQRDRSDHGPRRVRPGSWPTSCEPVETLGRSRATAWCGPGRTGRCGSGDWREEPSARASSSRRLPFAWRLRRPVTWSPCPCAGAASSSCALRRPPLETLRWHPSAVKTLAWAGLTLVSGGTDGALAVWDLADLAGSPLICIAGPSSAWYAPRRTLVRHRAGQGER